MMPHSAFARRALAGLGLALLGFTGCTTPTARPGATEPIADVIVVGAGLSGLTTAKDLRRAGKTVLVLEATDRIGGRAHTDTTFNAPKKSGAATWFDGIDLGAAWIHGADQNPLTALVDEMGFSRAPSKLDGPVWIGSRRLPPEEHKAFETNLP